jgi:hypothetical protein
MNLGYPLLSEDAELIVDTVKTIPRDAEAEKGLKEFNRFVKPSSDFREQVFIHMLKADKDGFSSVTLKNNKLNISLTIRYDAVKLPYLIQWRMLGKGEYVVGLEPSNVPLKNRVELRESDQLPMIEPGESTVNRVEVILKGL